MSVCKTKALKERRFKSGYKPGHQAFLLRSLALCLSRNVRHDVTGCTIRRLTASSSLGETSAKGCKHLIKLGPLKYTFTNYNVNFYTICSPRETVKFHRRCDFNSGKYIFPNAFTFIYCVSSDYSFFHWCFCTVTTHIFLFNFCISHI